VPGWSAFGEGIWAEKKPGSRRDQAALTAGAKRP
jgi:hypothetical protein